MEKKCTKCNTNKSLNEFFKDKGFKDGHYSQCKQCKTEATYLWRKNNPKKYNSLAVKWRDKNPDKQHAADIKRHYGITSDQYNQTLIKQNHKCYICDKTHSPSIKRGRLYVDHDHATGKVRGLLCSGCNSAIGYFQDDIEIMQKAIEYLKKNKYNKI